VLTLQSRTRKYASFAIYSSGGTALREHPIPKFQLMVPAMVQQMYYLRVSPDGTPALQLELRSLDNYLQTYRYKTWFDGVRLSAMTILIAITLAALLFTRDTTYLWLATYGVFIQAYQIVYTPDFGPSIFSIDGRWSAFLPQAMLLLASACSVRLAQVFPVFSGATKNLRPWLYVPLGANLLAIPLLYVAPGLEQVDVTMILVSASVIIAIAAALYTFLATHQQNLLSYALIRIGMVLTVTGGTLVLYSDSSTKPLVSSLLPLAMPLELFGLLVLLCKCSIDKVRQQGQRDRQIAALEAEGRSRTEMIAEMGHRIRTPVSGVLGMLEMLQDTPLTATQLDYTNTIRRAGNELLNIVNDLADMRNVVVQVAELQQSSFDPQALVADCIDGFRGLADAHHLELISDPAPELSVYVSGDPTRLRQIVLQLLHHAVSQHEGGEIVIQVRPAEPNWLRFQITVHGQRAQTAVSDMDSILRTQPAFASRSRASSPTSWAVASRSARSPPASGTPASNCRCRQPIARTWAMPSSICRCAPSNCWWWTTVRPSVKCCSARSATGASPSIPPAPPARDWLACAIRTCSATPSTCCCSTPISPSSPTAAGCSALLRK
jgi:signal transduction histidine kinase